jgi:putative N6-adenine-specific DNA methylase
MMSAQQFFASCPRGLETFLADELRAIGAANVETSMGGVHFRGEFEFCYRVNLESRIASRVFWQVCAGAYRKEDDIFQAARALPWTDWFKATHRIMVETNARNCPLKSLDFVTLRIKDAICDSFRDLHGTRPDVDRRSPDIRISAFLTADAFTIYLDTSGEPLFKRGYRDARIEAPLKENLAAGILRMTGWLPTEPLLDPMCGSGTFVIEAAMIALKIAPGINRNFAFQKLSNFVERDWNKQLERARSMQLAAQPLQIFGSDKYGDVVKVARTNLVKAGLSDVVQLKQVDALEMSAPAANGVLIANPPYGVRIGEQEELAADYPRLGDILKRQFSGWRAYFFSADTQLPKGIRLSASKRTPLFNGPLECRLYEYEIQAGSMRKPNSDTQKGSE